jgi:hypothetical protein
MTVITAHNLTWAIFACKDTNVHPVQSYVSWTAPCGLPLPLPHQGCEHPLATHPVHWPLFTTLTHNYVSKDDNHHSMLWCPGCYRQNNITINIPTPIMNHKMVKWRKYMYWQNMQKSAFIRHPQSQNNRKPCSDYITVLYVGLLVPEIQPRPSIVLCWPSIS